MTIPEPYTIRTYGPTVILTLISIALGRGDATMIQAIVGWRANGGR